MTSQVKITVVKRLTNQDLIDEYGANVAPQCPAVQEGQEFVVNNLAMPAGFCAWAWADIQRDVITLALGGNFPWINRPGVILSSCTDGLRPVIFKLERIEAAH